MATASTAVIKKDIIAAVKKNEANVPINVYAELKKKLTYTFDLVIAFYFTIPISLLFITKKN
jgi:hypothetical protein